MGFQMVSRTTHFVVACVTLCLNTEISLADDRSEYTGGSPTSNMASLLPRLPILIKPSNMIQNLQEPIAIVLTSTLILATINIHWKTTQKHLRLIQISRAPVIIVAWHMVAIVITI